MLYEMDSSQIGDYKSNVQFANELFMQFKQKNIDEGINGSQAIWLHHRTRAMNITAFGINYTLDIINMAASGDIETACLSLMYSTPDDMTEPQHWLTQDRIDFLVSSMKTHLGWP